ncbi:DUF6463 family protein [Streptomyces sp. NPDC008313]|uniref:DUF6463 family protein n=1 Tax=Streptomyces sp. NPDC008313 TaxID=3364826 RepID=UPI0036DFD80C
MKRQSAGQWLQLVGIGHGAIGAVIYRDVLTGVACDGFGSVPRRGDRAAAFWFMVAAPALWMGGRLLRSAEEHEDVPAQRAAGAVLTAVGVTGTAVMPKSGFPALIGIGGLLLGRSRRGRAVASARRPAPGRREKG